MVVLSFGAPNESYGSCLRNPNAPKPDRDQEIMNVKVEHIYKTKKKLISGCFVKVMEKARAKPFAGVGFSADTHLCGSGVEAKIKVEYECCDAGQEACGKYLDEKNEEKWADARYFQIQDASVVPQLVEMLKKDGLDTSNADDYNNFHAALRRLFELGESAQGARSILHDLISRKISHSFFESTSDKDLKAILFNSIQSSVATVLLNLGVDSNEAPRLLRLSAIYTEWDVEPVLDKYPHQRGVIVDAVREKLNDPASQNSMRDFEKEKLSKRLDKYRGTGKNNEKNPNR